MDGADGKTTIRLDETLSVPGITVYLFSLQRVLDMGYLPVYGEVRDKCIIKKAAVDGALTQVATMTIKKGRAILDCASTTSPRRTSGPALQVDILKVELNMQLLHRRMGHSGIDAMRKLLMGRLVRGIEGV